MTNLIPRVGSRVPITLALLVVVALPSTAEAQAGPAERDFVREFPSAESTVVGTVGFIDRNEVGSFSSDNAGHLVSQRFHGPSELTRVTLRITVVRNLLFSRHYVTWALEVNGVVVGGLRIRTQSREFRLRVSFPPIPGPDYGITIRVMNFTPGGSHTLAYAGSLDHSITLTGAP